VRQRLAVRAASALRLLSAVAMRLSSAGVLLLTLALSWLPVIGAAKAELSATAAPAAKSLPNKGPWLAELGGAVLGDLMATALTTSIIVPLYCEDPEGDGCDTDQDRLFALGFGAGFTARVLAVGGLTAACARPFGGEGKSWAAMLGAAPGAALIYGSWYGNDDYAGALVVLGHLGSVVGAVVAYRASAKRQHVRSEARSRWAPTMTAHGSLGLSVSGTF
jgi:hypothetical protein